MMNKIDFVGMYLHIPDKDGDVVLQGRIISRPEERIYIVQLFEWLIGDISYCVLVNIDDMESWRFFPTIDEMREAVSIVDIQEKVKR